MATQFKKDSNTKSDYGRVPDGTYSCRVVQAIMLGDQLQSDWQTGEPKKDDSGNDLYKPEVWITFEFPTERIKYTDKDGNEVDRPRWQSKCYLLSMNDKANFRKLMDTLVPGGEGGLSDLINVPCTVNIGSTSSGKAKIVGVSSPIKGVVIPELENPPMIYDLDEPDEEVFKNLPEFLRGKISDASNKAEVADPFAA